MKTVFALITLFSLQQAFAQSETELVKGDLKLSAATGEIISVRSICPPFPINPFCMAYGSLVKVKVGLNGCMDRLGGYSSKVEVIDGKGVIYFSAINVANEASRIVRCNRQATEVVTLSVAHEGEIELVNLDFVGSKN